MATDPILIDDIIKRLQYLKEQHGNLEVRHYTRMYPLEAESDTYPLFTAVPLNRKESGGTDMVVVVI